MGDDKGRSVTIDLRTGTLDASIAERVDLEELQLRNVPPGYVLPDALLALPRLHHLGLDGVNNRLEVPALVARLAIDHLDVWDCHASDLPALPSLRRLEIVVQDPRTEVAILAAQFPQLTHLEIWGSHLAAGELPDEIAKFTQLEALYLVSCGLSTVPDAFAQLARLRTLGIRGVPMTQLPEAITRLPALEMLELGVPLAGLPASLKQLASLRRLRLRGALNKGALISRFDDTSKLKALPKVVGELTNLEELVLDHCGVVDLAPLRPLTRLTKLSLAWSGITTLADLAVLTNLEELSLEHCDRVTDLAPLAKLTKLRVLNLSHTRTKTLDALIDLPALKVLHIERIETKKLAPVYALDLELIADEAVAEQYKQRWALKRLPPVNEQVAALASTDVAIVQTALDQLATLAIASSTRGKNAIGALLGLSTPAQAEEDEGEDDDDDDEDRDDYDDDDENDGDDDDDDEADEGDDESGATIRARHRAGDAPAASGTPASPARRQRLPRGALPPIDDALDFHLPQLASSTLVHLFAALFHDCRDNFPAAARIAAEVARRGDDAAELAVIDVFITANATHNTGHRTEDMVFDVLLDEVFPSLRGPALTRLLAWCTNSHLDDTSGDRMFALFLPALAAADDAERATLVKRLELFMREITEFQVDRADGLWSSLDSLTGPAHDDVVALRDRLEVGMTDGRARKKQRQRLTKALESRDAAIVTPALLELRALPESDVSELTGALWSANRTEKLPKEARRALLATWQRLDSDYGVARAIAGWAPALSPDELRADLDVLTGDAAARGALLRLAILEGIATVPPPKLDLLRAIATEYDRRPPDVAASAEVQALIYGAAKRYETDHFLLALTPLGALARYVPPDRKIENPGELASLIAMMAEGGWAKALGAFARHVHKLGITGKPLERILAQLIAVAMGSDDKEAAAAVNALVPATVTWDTLAFNLACKAARDGDRPAMLRFTGRALELGKSPDQFLADGDFAPFKRDPELLALLDSHR